MMVMEKTRDSCFESMGTRKSQVRRLFIMQGLLIGVIGTAIGLVLGYALSWAGGHYHLLSLAPKFIPSTTFLSLRAPSMARSWRWWRSAFRWWPRLSIVVGRAMNKRRTCDFRVPMDMSTAMSRVFSITTGERDQDIQGSNEHDQADGNERHQPLQPGGRGREALFCSIQLVT